jgi:hypothetical protein
MGRVLAGKPHFAGEAEIVTDEHAGTQYESSREGSVMAVANADNQAKVAGIRAVSNL